MKAVRRIQFCAGHRVMGHGGKCRHPHGHNYVAMLYAESDEVDDLGMVVDFSVLKGRVGRWIDTHWDHAFIYHERDRMVRIMLDEFEGQADEHPRQFKLPANPTAENMAGYLLRVVCPTELAGTGATVTRVDLWETENCFATVEL